MSYGTRPPRSKLCVIDAARFAASIPHSFAGLIGLIGLGLIGLIGRHKDLVLGLIGLGLIGLGLIGLGLIGLRHKNTRTNRSSPKAKHFKGIPIGRESRDYAESTQLVELRRLADESVLFPLREKRPIRPALFRQGGSPVPL